MSGADFILEWCKVSSYGQYYNVMTRVGLSCRTVQRQPPMRGRRWANYGFESWRMRGASSLGTIRTTPYCYHRAVCKCIGILRYSERPRATTTEQPPDRRISSTARSIGEWKPLITILSVWAISCAHRLARSSASGGAVRDAKKATKYLFNNSLLPDKSIKKRRPLH